MVLLRRVIGDALRARRQGQHRTLREVSSAANVSLGYLSEIERGQKEASSELLAAICDALGARLSELLRDVSDTVEVAEGLPAVLVPVQEGPVSGRDGVRRPESGGPAEDAGRAAPTYPEPVRQSGAAEPARQPVSAEPVRQSGIAEPARQAAAAEPARTEPAAQSALVEASLVGPGLADRALRSLAEGGVHQLGAEPVRQVATDGTVSVTVRQESPLKATLRTTRRIRPSADSERDVVCVG
ncbi:helix-turn-helix domain-containing protein [Plantactinospora veratri]|uniref:helix-turn-helix domain-containing protein n=1 Tax=Plantactinospora veratri TaxID=1436122 RepID=UPI0038B4BAA1